MISPVQLILRLLFELVKRGNSGGDGVPGLLRDPHHDQPMRQRRVLQQIRQLLLLFQLLRCGRILATFGVAGAGTAAAAVVRSRGVVVMVVVAVAATAAAVSGDQGCSESQLLRKVLDQLALKGADLMFRQFWKERDFYCTY